MSRSKLELQEYLRKNGLQSLETLYKISSKRHKDYPNLVLLKYDMIESPMGEKIVQQCRGIILDETDNWKVIARPYDKFFNLGEEHAAKIDWSTVKVYEKLDGSLFTMYWYDNEWHVATSGMPDALGEVANHPKEYTFHDLFWTTFLDRGYKLPDEKDRDKCFMFELMTPFNRVVVQHKYHRVALHGARYIDGEMEEMYPQAFGHKYGWDIVPCFDDLADPEKIQGHADRCNPLEKEGFILCDAFFNRVKVKGEGYVRLHHVITNMSKRRLLDVVRKGEWSEVLAYFPEWYEAAQELLKRYELLVMRYDKYYSSVKEIPSQKDFALKVTAECKYPAALFAVRNNRVKSIREYFTNLKIESLEEILEENNDSIEPGNCSREVREDQGEQRGDRPVPHGPEAGSV